MSSEGPETVSYVFVKNLKDGKKNVIKSDKLWVIEPVSKSTWKRTKMRIANVDLFKSHLKALKAKDKAPVFAIESGDSMVKHFVIDIEGDLLKLQSSLLSSRPNDPKRLSISDASVPLKFFLNHEEKEKAKSSKKETQFKSDSALGKKVKRSVHDEALKRLKKADSSATSRKRHATTIEVNVVEPKKPTPQWIANSKDDTSFNKTSLEELSLHDNLTDVIESQTNCCVEQDDNVTIVSAESQTKSCVEQVDNDTIVNMESQTKSSLEREDIVKLDLTSALKAKIKALTDQRDMALSESMALRFEMDNLREDLKREKTQNKTLLETIAADVKKIPAKVTITSHVDDGKLATLLYAHELENEFNDFEVPEGKVYVGDGKTISREELIEIEDDYKTLNQRGEHVFKLMCPDGMGNYTYKGHKSTKGTLRIMPKHVIASSRKILKMMRWPVGSPFDGEEFVRFLQKHPGDVRRRGTKKKAKGGENDKPGIEEKKETKEEDKVEEQKGGNLTEGEEEPMKTDAAISVPTESDNKEDTSDNEVDPIIQGIDFVGSDELASFYTNFLEKE